VPTKWVTRENAKVDRIACPWLIRRFIDRDAEFLYVAADAVMAVAEREGAIPYDVPGVELGHVAGRCSFESILLKYDLAGDPALTALAKIVHAADVAEDIETDPVGWGLMAIARGFALLLTRRANCSGHPALAAGNRGSRTGYCAVSVSRSVLATALP